MILDQTSLNAQEQIAAELSKQAQDVGVTINSGSV
jgi:hypothetical protein